MENNLLQLLDDTTQEFLDAIAAFSQEQFNQVPFAGSRTAGQVAEHVYKSESGVPHVWRGGARTTERPVDQHVPLIKSIFLDFNAKYQSPDFILPSEGAKQKDGLYEAIRANRTVIRELAAGIDLNQTFTDFEFPQIGELTGVEWAVFLASHSKRHARQLRSIYSLLTK